MDKMEVERSAEDLKELGNKKLAQKQFDEAAELYTQAIALDPSSPIYYHNRAVAYLNMAHDPQNSTPVAIGLAQKALADCDAGIKADPKYTKCYFRRGMANTSLGRLREAKMDFEKVAQLEPANSQYKEKIQIIEKIERHLHNATELESRGDFEAAARFYEAALALAPNSVTNKLGLARTLNSRKMYSDAAKVASSVLQSNPEDVAALLIRAQAFYGMGEDWTKLGPYIRNILQLDPDNREAFALRKKSQMIYNLKNQGNEKFTALKKAKNSMDMSPEEKEAFR